MANEQNLRPVSVSREKAREYGRKGGKATQKKRLQIKSFKEACQLFMDMKCPDGVAREIKKHFPVLEDTQINGLTAMVFAQKAKALKGDSKAFELIRDTAGEKPIDRIKQEGQIINKVKVEIVGRSTAGN
jgi:hypothetical protein